MQDVKQKGTGEISALNFSLFWYTRTRAVIPAVYDPRSTSLVDCAAPDTSFNELMAEALKSAARRHSAARNKPIKPDITGSRLIPVYRATIHSALLFIRCRRYSPLLATRKISEMCKMKCYGVLGQTPYKAVYSKTRT